MHFGKTVATLLVIAGAGLGTAHADTIYNVTAAYDPFQLGNTTFTVDNLSGQTLTNVDITSGNETKVLANIGVGQSVTYAFDDQPTGNFILGAGDKGLLDTTTYQVNATYQGATVSTADFSRICSSTVSAAGFSPSWKTCPLRITMRADGVSE